MHTKVLVLLSGGLDSTTVAALAVDRMGKENVGAISIIYGQKHVQEIESAYKVSAYLGIESHFIHDLTPIFKGGEGTSALLIGGKSIPHLTYEELGKQEGPSPTYVPLRNPVMITIASAIALIHGYNEVWVGVHADDAARDAYPDCRTDVIGALGAALFIGSYSKIRLRAPIGENSKSGVVKLGVELGAPLHLTYSCYQGGEVHCGQCPTCVSRKWAFTAAGVKDPTEYMNSWTHEVAW